MASEWLTDIIVSTVAGAARTSFDDAESVLRAALADPAFVDAVIYARVASLEDCGGDVEFKGFTWHGSPALTVFVPVQEVLAALGVTGGET